MSPRNSTKPFVSVLDLFEKVKRSGGYRRKLKKSQSELLNVRLKRDVNVLFEQQQQQSNSLLSNFDDDPQIESNGNWMDGESSDGEEFSNTELQKTPNLPTMDFLDMQAAFRNVLSKWAIQCNINQHQLRELIAACNETLPFELPVDPRTILHTPRSTVIRKLSNDGQYWHRGLEQSLLLKLEKMSCLPQQISLNVNIDGLPISKSSNKQFWPILFNIHEFPSIKPGIVGVFCGTGDKNLHGSFICVL